MKSWFGVSGRFDHVRLDNDFNRRAFTIYTARLLFHTNWLSRDEFALQYSHFVYGREVYVANGFPPVDNPSLTPDRDVLLAVGHVLVVMVMTRRASSLLARRWSRRVVRDEGPPGRERRLLRARPTPTSSATSPTSRRTSRAGISTPTTRRAASPIPP